MRLKKLSIVGFKSFADRVVLNFDADLIGVVGPNGCGKSNIVDAFRWVLGEQSAKSMRGDKMHDVLFAGTAKRKPLGFAEVSVTLSDVGDHLPIDYDEVTITRRLHRSGESEYLINNQAVRLRDIHELLMGSGIGKNTFSVFEQGKLDQVIHLSPLERRSIFDECAGIGRFLHRKKETVRKLAQVTENYNRVKDLHAEVDKQARVLKRQAAAAQSYKEKQVRLDQLEKALLLHRWEKADEKSALPVDDAKSEAEKAKEALTLLLGELEEVKRERSKEEKRARAINELKHELHLKETSLSHERRELMLRQDEGEVDQEALEREIKALEQGASAWEKKRHTARAALKALEKERHACVAAQTRNEASEKRLEKVTQLLAEKESLLKSAKKEIAERKKKVEALKKESGVFQKSVAAAEQQAKELGERRKTAASDVEALVIEAAQLEARYAELEGDGVFAAELPEERRALLACYGKVQIVDDLKAGVADMKTKGVEAYSLITKASPLFKKMKVVSSLTALLKEKGTAVSKEGFYLDANGVLFKKGKDRHDLKKSLDALRKKLAHAKEGAQKLEGEWQEAQRAHQEEERARRSQEMTFVEANFGLQRLTGDLERTEKELETLQKEKKELEKQLRAEITKVEDLGDGSELEKELEQIVEAHQKTTLQLHEKRSELSRYKRLVRETQEREERIAKLEAAVSLKEAELSNLKGGDRLGEWKEKQRELEKGVDHLRKEVSRLEERRHKLEVALAEETSVKKMAEHALMERFNLTIEAARALELETIDSIDETEKTIRQLRATLERAGAVNMTSIEECKEQEERVTHLADQLNDLEETKKDLEKIIATLDVESRRLFKATFAEVRANFQKNFAILFDGGEADLKFTESPDVLEAGVEIVAKPPGKQMRSISLMSGGEKCLTALALLFAIFEHKPAPFCILDEVDAPLDDTNIGRFTNVLQQFLSTTQFIIVTHNKKTMAIAEILFGVSMEEKGVSKLLSLSFEKKEALQPA